MTPQLIASPVEELLGPDVYIDADLRQHADGPGLLQACRVPKTTTRSAYYAPQPRAVVQVVDFDDPDKLVDYGQTGRVMLTTLTKEFFMPRFLERDEGRARDRRMRSIPGTASAASGRSAVSRQRRRWACTKCLSARSL